MKSVASSDRVEHYDQDGVACATVAAVASLGGTGHLAACQRGCDGSWEQHRTHQEDLRTEAVHFA